MAKPYTVSPSQLKTFAACPRKWGLQKLAGLADPPGPGAKLGSEVHNHIEAWLLERKTPPANKSGRIAKTLIAETVPPSSEHVVEHGYYLERPGVTFHGRIDLLYCEGDMFVTRDHKTCKSFRYALTEETLPLDPQAVQYAAAVMEWKGVSEVMLEWAYVTTTSSPEVRKVRVPMDLVKVQRPMFEQAKIGRTLTVLKSANADPYDLPVNMHHCDAFGGCPYYGKECNPQPHEQGNENMNQLIARMKERNQAKKVNPPTKAEAEEKPKVDLKTKPKKKPEPKQMALPHTEDKPAEPVSIRNASIRDQFALAIVEGLATQRGPADIAKMAKDIYEAASALESAR